MTRSDNILWLKTVMRKVATENPDGIARIPAHELVRIAMGHLEVIQTTAESYVDAIINSKEFTFDRQCFIVKKEVKDGDCGLKDV